MPPQSSGRAAANIGQGGNFVAASSSSNMNSLLGEEEDFVSSEATELFHDMVREYTICALIFFSLYLLAHALLSRYKRRDDREDMWTDKDDHTVYRITMWICTFACAIAIAATLLLPVSIVSNEVKLRYPASIYIEWLNSSLIAGLWNYVSLFANAAIFVLLPFGYLFTESQGFAGSRRGLMPRVYETVIIFILFSICMLGLAAGILALLNSFGRRTVTDLFTFYLPLLFSAVSFMGVVLLLACTPMGHVHVLRYLWRVLKQGLQTATKDNSEDSRTEYLEAQVKAHRAFYPPHIHRLGSIPHSISLLPTVEFPTPPVTPRRTRTSVALQWFPPCLAAGGLLLSLVLTLFESLFVARHMVELLSGRKSLPLGVGAVTLGVQSLSSLGLGGALLQILLIFHLLLCSLIGFYSLPWMHQRRPRISDTSIAHLLLNSLCLLLVSSALPVQSRLLGITDFSLLGTFGRLDWLGSIWLVLGYNLTFAVVTVVAVLRLFVQRTWPDVALRLKELSSLINGQTFLITTIKSD